MEPTAQTNQPAEGTEDAAFEARQDRQIGDMLGEPPAPSDETPTEESPTGAVGEEDPQVEPPAESKADGGGEEAEPAWLKKFEDRFAALEQRLSPPKEPEAPPKVEVTAPEDLVSEEDISDFSEDPIGVLKRLSAKIYQKAREDTLADLPRIVEQSAARQTTIAEARTNFWNSHKDLQERVQSNPDVGRLIRVVANELQAENPGWSLEQIFTATGARVRQTLGIQEEARKIERNLPRQPGKPRNSTRGAGGEDQRSEEQRQIDAMLAII